MYNGQPVVQTMLLNLVDVLFKNDFVNLLV